MKIAWDGLTGRFLNCKKMRLIYFAMETSGNYGAIDAKYLLENPLRNENFD